MPSVSVHVSDIRDYVRELATSARRIRPEVLAAIKKATEDAEEALRKLATGGAVQKRTGRLGKAVASKITERPYSFDIEVGFLKFRPSDERTVAASYTHTGESKMPIRPVSAEKLAYPVRGLSPGSIIRSNTRGLSVRAARDKYYLVYTDNAIMGRKLNSTVRDLVFLFARSDEVTVPQRIDLDEQEARLEENIANAIAERLDAEFA
jgi:hypothetical protein